MEIRLDDVTLSYNEEPVVRNVSGQFAPNSMTAIVGPNGGGKSTLLRSLMGLHSPDKGQCICSTCLTKRAYLPQLPRLDRGFPVSVIETVLMGLWKQSGAFRRIDRAQYRKAQQALELVGMQDYEKRPIGKLSAGQFQRVLFARIQLQEAPIVLLDEPFTGMDLKTIEALMKVLNTWQQEQRTVIAVLHDLEQVRALFPNTLLLAKNCIGWGKTSEVLSQANLAKAWGLDLNLSETSRLN